MQIYISKAHPKEYRESLIAPTQSSITDHENTSINLDQGLPNNENDTIKNTNSICVDKLKLISCRC